MTTAFSSSVSTYDEAAKVQRLCGDVILEHLPEDLNGLVVDLGCGTGRLARLVSEQFPDTQVLGVDRSEDMIQFAKEQHANDRVSFLCSDIETCSFSQTPSAIISNATLQWLASPNDFITSLSKAYPETFLCLNFFTKGTFFELSDGLKAIGVDTSLAADGFVDAEMLSFQYEYQILFDSVVEMLAHIRDTGTRGRSRGLFLTPSQCRKLESYFIERVGTVRLTFKTAFYIRPCL